jgi:hypothetical protein
MSVSINGSAGLTFNDGSTQNTSPFTGGFGFRNRIINGDMRIDQRNNGASVTMSAAVVYTVDRWWSFEDTDGSMTVQRSTTAPTGFTNSLLCTTTSADASLGATQRVVISQAIEGFNIADFGWGTASAQTVTLSFLVRSSLTGTFGGAVKNAGARSYPFTYSISAANTWEQKTVTIPGDTSGTWLTDNGVGMNVNFGLGVGSTYSGTAGVWAGSDLNSATGAVSVIGTNGATFYITGVQLEKGSTATSFDYRPYGTEEMLCKRYFQVRDSSVGIASNASVFGGTLPFGVDMRANPTLGLTAALQVTDTWSADFTQSPASIAIQSGRVTKAAVNFTCPNFSGMTQGRAMIMNPVSGGSITLSAEL